MSEEKEEEPLATGEMERPFDEREERSTSIDVTDKQISIGEIPFTVPQEEIVQEKPQEMEQTQVEPRVIKKEPKRRITSYLSNISKQVEKQGNQMNKITLMVQSLQKQKQNQSKSIRGAGVDKLQSQSITQNKPQISQLQKQVARIQNDIRRIGTGSILRTKTKSNSKSKKPSTSSTTKPRSKKSKLFKTTKVKKGRKNR
jgi:hypothetical protein